MPPPANLVHEISTSTGTGNFSLALDAQSQGKQRFSAAFGIGGTNVFDYFISNRNVAEYERGTGHMSGVSTLVRDTVLENHLGTTALVNFSAGTKDVTNDVPALGSLFIATGGEVNFGADDVRIEHTANELDFVVGGATIATVTDDGDLGLVGVMTKTPKAPIHVVAGGVPFEVFHGPTFTTGFAVQDDSPDDKSTGFSVISGRDGNSQVLLGDTDSQFACRLLYNHSDKTLDLRVEDVRTFMLDEFGTMSLLTAQLAHIDVGSSMELVGGLSGASVSTTNLVPAGATLLGVTCRVTTAITGATSFDIGDGTDIDRFGAGIAISSGTTTDHTDFTADPVSFSASAQDVTLTANGGSFTAGAVRVTAYYRTFTPSSS